MPAAYDPKQARMCRAICRMISVEKAKAKGKTSRVNSLLLTPPTDARLIHLVIHMIQYRNKGFNIVLNNTTDMAAEVMKSFVQNGERIPRNLDYEVTSMKPITVNYSFLPKRQALAKATIMHAIGVACLLDNLELNMFQWIQNRRVDQCNIIRAAILPEKDN